MYSVYARWFVRLWFGAFICETNTLGAIIDMHYAISWQSVWWQIMGVTRNFSGRAQFSAALYKFTLFTLRLQSTFTRICMNDPRGKQDKWRTVLAQWWLVLAYTKCCQILRSFRPSSWPALHYKQTWCIYLVTPVTKSAHSSNIENKNRIWQKHAVTAISPDFVVM